MQRIVFIKPLILLIAATFLAALPGQAVQSQAPTPTPATQASLPPAQVGDFELLAPQTGWLLAGDLLYRTDDGGAAWQTITPPGAATLWAVDFTDSTHGFSLTSPSKPGEPGNPQLVNFQLSTTTDGGATWQTTDLIFPQDSLTPELAMPESVLLRFSDPLNGWMYFKRPTSSNFNVGSLLTTPDGGHSWQYSPVLDGEPLTIESERLQAEGSQAAWRLETQGECQGKQNCRQVQRLLTTTDAGQTWQPLALPSMPSQSPDSPLPTPDSQPLSPDLLTTDQGFDKCEIPTLSQMQEWMTNGPYRSVNIYIGGIMRACANKALTAGYLSELDRQGWTLIPTWVGPQAACSGFKYVMSADPATAYNEGVAEADAAVAVANGLKLWGQAIYYDLEAFSTNNIGCLEAAKAFMDGWTFRLHEWGYLSGVYGSPCSSGLSDFWFLTNRPEAVWIAHWLLPAAYNPDATVWTTVCGFSNSYWPNHQRIRQYAGGHNETWGSVTMKVDSNAMDGVAAQTFGQPPQVCPLPSAPAQAGVILYTAKNYDCYGRQGGFGYLWQNRSGFANFTPFYDNRASSIYIPPGWSALLYENRDRGGGKICFNAPGDADFAGQTFDNGHALDSKASSMAVFAGSNCSEAAPVTPAADAQPPLVKITSHSSGDFINPGAGNITIQADLQDAGSGISHAQFFAGYDDGAGWSWHSLGYDNDGGNGWSFAWDPSNLAALTDNAMYIYAWDRAGNGSGSPVLHLNLADGLPPSSSIQALPVTVDTTAVQVSWQGTDNLSGIASYDVQVQDNGGAWQNWLVAVPGSQTSGKYYGQLGHTYGFRLRAVDQAGNQEAYPGSAEATTKVNPCTTDAYEADNAMNAARALAFNAAQGRTFCGLGDQDWLSFQALAGQSYAFYTSNLGADTDTTISLYNAAGNLLAINDDWGIHLASYVTYYAQQDAIVYLKLTHTDGRVAGNSVSYQVTAAPTMLFYMPLVAR